MTAISRDAHRVSLVVPTLNGGPRFLQLLDALAGQDVEDGFELVVVDSGSTDGTPEAAAAAGAYVFRVPGESFNHGGTRNLAIERTRGEFVCLLTQDAVPTGGEYLRNLVAPYDDPRVDGVYARQVPRPDCDPILAERLRRWSASRGEREVRVLAQREPEAARRHFEALEPMERYLRCAFDNVASSVRRAAWERIPFPERTFGEDVAWGRAVLLAGGGLCFEPSAAVEHSHRIDMAREFRRIYCDHRNLFELFDLRNVPSWREVFRGWKGQRRLYRELLRGQDLPVFRRLYWRGYSIPYAFLETAAQLLGARSHGQTRAGGFWHRADVRIRAGI